MNKISFEITPDSHDDHMTKEILTTALGLCQAGEAKTIVPPQAGIFIGTVVLPAGSPLALNALRGPMSAEGSPSESQCYYGVRGGRPCLSRMTKLPSVPTRLVTVIVLGTEETDGTWHGKLATAYGGPCCPQEPGDPFLNGEDAIEQAQKAWSEHALSDDTGPRVVAASAVLSDFLDPERSREIAKATNEQEGN